MMATNGGIMIKSRQSVLTVLVFTASFCSLVQAVPPAARARHADRNRDGVVTPREVRADKTWAHDQKAKVNTPWEARADKDHDGVVEPREAARLNSAHYMRTASLVDRPWEARADLNNDGRVNRAELHVYHLGQLDADHNGLITPAERQNYWVGKRAVVNTPLEKRYDTNGDGYLSWIEGREFLKDRLILINTHGKALVSNELEMEFDANKDGIIDLTEAAKLKNALASQ